MAGPTIAVVKNHWMGCLLWKRGLMLSGPNCKDELMKRARIIEKLVNKGKTRKKQSRAPMSNKSFGEPAVNKRRVAVLSNLFMEHITEVMSTEECALQLQGYGIEITHVKVSGDCKIVNVYWTLPSEKYNQVETVSKLLKSSAGEIRSEMIRQNVLGIMPYINFVQDRAARNAVEVEKLLSIADYGPDYIPANAGKVLQDNLAALLNTAEEDSDRQKESFYGEKKSHQESKSLCLDSTKQQQDSDSDMIKDLPPMKMNVFGLDYNAIMNQVIHKMKKPHLLQQHPEEKITEYVENSKGSVQNVDLSDSIEKRRIVLESFLKDRKKQMQMKNIIAMPEIQPEDEGYMKDPELYPEEDTCYNSQEHLEEEDYYDESDVDGNQHYIPQNDDSENK